MKEYFKEQLDRTNYWLSFLEAKNGALIAVNVGIIAVCVQISSMCFFIQALVFVLFLLSTLVCLLSFYPNLSDKFIGKKREDDSEVNLSFYGDIARIKDVKTYMNLVKEKYHLPLDYEEMCLDLAAEVMINSKIAITKYKLFKRAVLVDVFAVLVFCIGIILG